MGKLKEVAIELDEQAVELGFDSYLDAISRGGYTTYFNGKTFVLAKPDADEQEVAHEAWLIERETIINKLEMLRDDTEYEVYREALSEAIEFIKKGEV